MSGCVSFGPPSTLYYFSDSAYSVYTDKNVNNIIYFGHKNHYIFEVNDKKIRYLIQNADNGNLHINIATHHYAQEISDVITYNLVHVSFKTESASPELIEWARSNNIYYDSNKAIGPRYSYQVHLNAKRYLASKNVNDHIKRNDQQLSMSFETIVNTNDVKLASSPVRIVDGQPYLEDKPIFELIDYGWYENSQYRTILYKQNVQ